METAHAAVAATALRSARFEPKPSVDARLGALIEEVARYRIKLETHPMARLCAEDKVRPEILKEYARLQYVDSVLWIPMLALIKGMVKSPRLVRAVRENILCEAGYDDIPHITLCKDFVESLGEPSQYGDFRDYAPRAEHPVEIMNALTGLTEAAIAGWLLAAETLVPVFFSLFRPAIARLPGADLRYLDEHISIDSDEHSQWMREAVTEILAAGGDEAYSEILTGIDLGGRHTLAVPDVLYARTVRRNLA